MELGKFNLLFIIAAYVNWIAHVHVKHDKGTNEDDWCRMYQNIRKELKWQKEYLKQIQSENDDYHKRCNRISID